MPPVSLPQFPPNLAQTRLNSYPLAGLLARHLRRHRPHGAFRLRPPAVRHLHLYLPRAPPAWHRGHHRVLLRRLRRRHGHGSEVVHRARWQEDWPAGLWWRCGLPARVCVQRDQLCGPEVCGKAAVWEIRKGWDGRKGGLRLS